MNQSLSPQRGLAIVDTQAPGVDEHCRQSGRAGDVSTHVLTLASSVICFWNRAKRACRVVRKRLVSGGSDIVRQIGAKRPLIAGLSVLEAANTAFRPRA